MQKSLQIQLTRSSSDRVLAGVAGGLARYFAVDSTIMRLVMLMLGLSGVGIIIYPVLWLIMPRDTQDGETVYPGPGARFDPMSGEPLQDQQEAPQTSPQSAQGARKRATGVVLLGLGSFILADMLVPWGAELLFPTLLIAAGLLLISKRR